MIGRRRDRGPNGYATLPGVPMNRARPWTTPAVAVLAATAVLATACARRQETPPAARVRSDVVLPVETQTIEAVVPRQATLETILSQHELPAPTVQAAIESTRSVFNPRLLRAELIPNAGGSAE